MLLLLQSFPGAIIIYFYRDDLYIKIVHYYTIMPRIIDEVHVQKNVVVMYNI